MNRMINKKRAIEIEYQNEKQWINGKPVKLGNLAGKVVLIDFWTYSCINCIRTIPYLKKIYEKYKNKRFALIGIHTPEFEFEKEIGNVKYAVKKHGIQWPVLSDPSRNNWENYGNKYWPRVAVVDGNGNILFEHVGEQGYWKIDSIINDELGKMNEYPPEKENSENIGGNSGISEECYAGKSRGKEIIGLSSSKEGCDVYAEPKNREAGRIYLNGEWKREKEYLEYTGKDYEGWLDYKFYAKEFNLVAGGVGKAEIELDGKPIQKDCFGKDIEKKDNESTLDISGPDMYNIISLKSVNSREAKIKAFNGMKIYSLSFG